MHKTDKLYFVNQVAEKLYHLKSCSISDSEPFEKYFQFSSNQVKKTLIYHFDYLPYNPKEAT